MINPYRFEKEAKAAQIFGSLRDAIEVEVTGPADLLQSCLNVGADIFDKPLKALLSPMCKLSLPVDMLDEMNVPRQARAYSFFYPCDALSRDVNVKRDTLSQREDLLLLVAFGGFVYFDRDGLVVCFHAFVDEGKHSYLKLDPAMVIDNKDEENSIAVALHKEMDALLSIFSFRIPII